MIEKLKQMPKIELHLHLDGSVDIQLASKLLGKKVEELKSEMVASSKCKDLNEYLTKFKLPIELMQTKDNLKLIAHDLGQKLKNQNVIYAEVRFAPIYHTKEGLSLDDVISAIKEGFQDYNINLILCMMRGESFENNLKVIKLAKKYLNNGVVGIDLAGAEGIYPTSDYEKLFALARNEKIPFTIHAGEAAGSKSVMQALNFGSKRIGHGVRCLEDNNLVNRIIEDNVILEICPTSNVQTNVVDKYENHPIYKLYKKGVKVCINTDNTTVSNVSLTDEYIKLYKAFNFTLEDYKKFNLNALDASFITDKEKLRDIINNFDTQK